MANFKCDKCGELMHLGECEYGNKAKPVYSIARDPSGEWLVYVDHQSGPVARGFDNALEAQEWIDEQ